MMLELGLMPVRYVITIKRLTYLHHLVTNNPTMLARQVLLQQMKKPIKGDFVKLCNFDMKQLQITIPNETLLKMTKPKFKYFIKDACKKAAFKFLLKQKSKLSKGSEISYTCLQTQNYFLPENRLTVTEMQNIFLLRSRNLPVQCNFPKQFTDRKCIVDICNGDDKQEHIFDCKYLEENTNTLTNESTSYADLFRNNIYKQVTTMYILMNKFKSN